MSLKLTLQGIGPGRGLLRVEGHSAPVESVNLALRRNDGRYLGADGSWQPMPHWHPQFGAEPRPDGLHIGLGPALMDPIVAMHGQPLLLTLRLDEHEDSGVPRIRGALMGSDAAAGPDKDGAHRTDIPAGPQRAASEPPPAMDAAEDRAPAGHPQNEPAGAHTTAISGRRSRWPLLLGVTAILALLGAGLGLAWYLGWLAPWIEPPQASRTEAPPAEPEAPFLPAPDSALTGRAFAADLLAASPSPMEILGAAEDRSAAGDCDAALILYASAVDADGALGAQVARLYDPASFTPGGCIDAPNREIALEYLRTAAEAGDPAAMRRAGEMLIQHADSGPLHDEGRAWLQRADAAEEGAER